MSQAAAASHVASWSSTAYTVARPMAEPASSLTIPAGGWTLLVALLGAAVGSFLNVVIYRLPRGLSISRPRLSFCPTCRQGIAPYDNIPILSWFLLRGRCRHCGEPIAAIYPVIECLTLLLFITVWDAAFVGFALPGVERPAADWPVALAWIVLLSGLLATAVMDLESYTVDIRICVVTMLVGVATRAVWMSEVPGASGRMGGGSWMPASVSLVACLAGGAWVATCLVAAVLRRSPDDAAAARNQGLTHEPVVPDSPTGTSPPSRSSGLVAGLCLAVVVLLIWQAWAPAEPLFGSARHGPDAASHRIAATVSMVSAAGQRAFIAFSLFLLLLLLASMAHREADQQIIAEIEAERVTARTTALRELCGFLPAILVAAVAFHLLRDAGVASVGWIEIADRVRFLGGAWPHVIGGLEAVAGIVLASAVGWAARILGTLAFGKEAYGTGDIYLMAAIGAVAGPWVVLLSFFMAAFLALFGVLVLLFRKSSRAIPFGPWLALGTLAALWMQTFLGEMFRPAAAVLWELFSKPAG